MHFNISWTVIRFFFFNLGTIRTCQKFLIRYNRQQLNRMLPKCKNKGEACFWMLYYSYWTPQIESAAGLVLICFHESFRWRFSGMSLVYWRKRRETKSLDWIVPFFSNCRRRRTGSQCNPELCPGRRKQEIRGWIRGRWWWRRVMSLLQ